MQSELTFPQSLSEKYRPQGIGEFVGLEKPKKILAAFAQRPCPSAWLFVGPSGTGKTTMALALAKELGAELHHIPSQECNVERVKDVVHMCWYVPQGGLSKFHLVLVDEADQMSNAAQLAFLSKLDSTAFPPNTIFIFTANATDRLEGRFLSRCRVLEFSSYGMRAELATLLQSVWKRETGHDNGLDFARMAKDSTNNVRDALMKLELEILAL